MSGVGVFPNDGVAWGVGVVVGVVIAAGILGGIAVVLRRRLCPATRNAIPPPVQPQQPETTLVQVDPREADPNAALDLEVVSTGSGDRVRPHIGAFAVDSNAADDETRDSPREPRALPGAAVRGVRSIVMAKSAAKDAKRNWKY